MKRCEGPCLGSELDHIKTFGVELPNWCAMKALPVCWRARCPSAYGTGPIGVPRVVAFDVE